MIHWRLFILVLAIVLHSGCAGYRDYYESEGDDELFEEITPEETRAFIDDPDFSISLTYIGVGSSYFIFETTFENFSTDTLVISHRDFAMDVPNGRVMDGLERDLLIHQLRDEKKQLKKEKKKRTIWGVVVTGLSVVASATSGLPLAENLAYTAEPIAYIFEDRSFVQRNIDSVEDEQAYLYELAWTTEFIAPGEAITRDLIFPLQLVNGDVEVIYTKDRNEYGAVFAERLFRGRRR